MKSKIELNFLFTTRWSELGLERWSHKILENLVFVILLFSNSTLVNKSQTDSSSSGQSLW